MHKLAERPLELKDFSCEHLDDDPIQVNNDHAFYLQSSLDCLIDTIDLINTYRDWYIRTKDKQYWWQMIQLLPSSYNQKRTLSMNYQNVLNIVHQRANHKLDEWNKFCCIMKEELPYIKIFSELKN